MNWKNIFKRTKNTIKKIDIYSDKYLCGVISEHYLKLPDSEYRTKHRSDVSTFIFALRHCMMENDKKISIMDYCISNIILIQDNEEVRYIIETKRPGILIGKGGHFIDAIENDLTQTHKCKVRIILYERKYSTDHRSSEYDF